MGISKWELRTRRYTGNEAAREEMLERSLSLIHEREAVDITCETKEDCSRLAVWIDAKWSVAM